MIHVDYNEGYYNKIDYIEERMRLLSFLQRIYIRSDGRSAQFCFPYTFVLLTDLHSDKDIEWNYNEPHHGKRPMDKICGANQEKSNSRG